MFTNLKQKNQDQKTSGEVLNLQKNVLFPALPLLCTESP